MTDAIVTVVVEQLTTILLEKTKREVKLVTGVGRDLKKLKSNLESIHALLGDAEERQIKDNSIKLWLKKLKQVCYDMEDVLDEWNTSSLMLQKDEADKKNFSPFKGKACRPFNPCFSFGQVVQHRGIALKIKDIGDRLNEIDEEKNQYQLAQRKITESRREESTSYTELSKLHGRDKEMKDLINSLLCGSSDPGPGESDAKTIFVVGMGGVGKTALAQLSCKEIIVSLESLDHVSARDLDSVSLQILVEKICKSIQRKKVLLALDEVWTDKSSSLESLNVAFNHAAPENDSWKILSQEAFVGKTDEQCKSLEDMGRKIAEKCSGLPLVAKALGSMLRFRETEEEWENILNTEDFDIKRDDLIHQWMAQGYLSSSQNQEMEIIGVIGNSPSVGSTGRPYTFPYFHSWCGKIAKPEHLQD
ncbi:hypothetical protein SLEP1_g919 [Rubroshorea leprosula]|uniref:Uncharacterized protein n=1 Tax=Rubroshorea leprosula TaxID=152421 RepID=A0AAV5HJ47_9ROSI|nr:hypothetical protein SLEP1_g919 [Rubroshorea leprosula]